LTLVRASIDRLQTSSGHILSTLFVERLGDCVEVEVEQVGVHVQRDGCASVAELALYNQHVGTRTDRQAREKVIYPAAESAAGLRARILAWCERNNVEPATLDGWLYIMCNSLREQPGTADRTR
jgi:hypothetical protein